MSIDSINDLQKFMNRVDFIGPVYFGSSNDQTGQINFYNSSSQYATTFQAGNATAAATYTFPTGAPSASGFGLVGTTAGVLSWSNAIKGTSTNDSAAAGNVGEIIESAVTTVSFPSTGTFGDLTSIALTAGDWLVSVNMSTIANGATVSAIQAGLSTTSGNSSSGLTDGDTLARNAGPVNGVNGSSVSISNKHVQLSSPTTYYLKFTSTYSVATPTASGRITAQRIR